MPRDAFDNEQPRSKLETETSRKAHGILVEALTDQDAEGLLAAAKLMSGLTDPIGVWNHEISLAATNTLRAAPINTSNASTTRLLSLDAKDVMRIALQAAEAKGDAALVDDIRTEWDSIVDKPIPEGGHDRQACIWANCCGKYYCFVPPCDWN